MKKAFTLAEVLITLGIIGVVAAMTIPNLMTAHKKHETAARLKKSISVINQAIRMSEQDNGEPEIWDKSLSDEDFINKYFAPYMKIMSLCNPITKCGYKTSQWLYMNGSCGSYCGPNYMGRTPFLTMDGIVYTYSKVLTNEVDNTKMILVDVNGWRKPNQFGKDIFLLYRDEESNSITPYGTGKSRDELNRSCSKTGNGFYCATLIKENGWNIPNDYPW